MGKFIKLGKPALQKLAAFEQALNPQIPEGGALGAKIIGYGEMSTVFRFADKTLSQYAFKRMAIFHSNEEVNNYRALYLQYHAELKKRGVETPDFGCEIVTAANGRPVIYILQALLDVTSIANKRLHSGSLQENLRLYEQILAAIERVFAGNTANKTGIQLGFDGQISNWAFTRRLVYIDTSTPLTRTNGAEQLDAELFLRICPSYLVWIIKLFFLKDVMARYYDLRLVLIDTIANLYKEKRENWVAAFIGHANRFLAEKHPHIRPITKKEVASYYKEDKLIWRLFLFFRKVERWVRTKVLRQGYEIILPEKIDR